MVPEDELSDPTVRELVAAINAGDRERFFALLAPDATMSDDGTERDLDQWVDREIFSADGQMGVESEGASGRELIARFTNSTYGEMRTRWRFTIENGKITRFETGQA
jgi:hypothetical protein